jgi:hypothetical protein
MATIIRTKPSRIQRFTSADIERLVMMWDKGTKINTMARVLNCRPATINYWRAKLGLEPRREHASKTYTVVVIRLPNDLHAAYVEESTRRGLSMAELIREKLGVEWN